MGCSRGLASASLYLIGCILLLPASALILPSFPIDAIYVGEDFGLGIIFYVIACSFLTIAGIMDFVLETNTCYKSKKSVELDPFIASFENDNNTANKNEKNKYNILGWWIALFYLIGGVFFLLGSIAYLPSLDDIKIFSQPITTVGTWIFRFGSISYICGSVTSLYKMDQANKTNKNMQQVGVKPQKLSSGPDVSMNDIGTDTIMNDMYHKQLKQNKKCINSNCMWKSVLYLYIVGALLFITGGILFETENDGGELSWLVGSMFFALGAITGFVETIRPK